MLSCGEEYGKTGQFPSEISMTLAEAHTNVANLQAPSNYIMKSWICLRNLQAIIKCQSVPRCSGFPFVKIEKNKLNHRQTANPKNVNIQAVLPSAMPQWRTDLADTPAASLVRPVHWWPIPTSSCRARYVNHITHSGKLTQQCKIAHLW